MAIKDLIAPGLGFTPGSVLYLITRGLSMGSAVTVFPPFLVQMQSVWCGHLRQQNRYSPVRTANTFAAGARAEAVEQ